MGTFCWVGRGGGEGGAARRLCRWRGCRWRGRRSNNNGQTPMTSLHKPTNSSSKHQTLIRSPLQRSKMETQLEIVNRDIVAVGKQIVDEKAELKDAPEADKADIRKSLERLESRLDALIAHRRELSVALAAAPSPGKNTPSRPRRQCPPSTREHATPPRSSSHPLVRRHPFQT